MVENIACELVEMPEEYEVTVSYMDITKTWTKTGKRRWSNGFKVCTYRTSTKQDAWGYIKAVREHARNAEHIAIDSIEVLDVRACKTIWSA